MNTPTKRKRNNNNDNLRTTSQAKKTCDKPISSSSGVSRRGRNPKKRSSKKISSEKHPHAETVEVEQTPTVTYTFSSFPQAQDSVSAYQPQTVVFTSPFEGSHIVPQSFPGQTHPHTTTPETQFFPIPVPILVPHYYPILLPQYYAAFGPQYYPLTTAQNLPFLATQMQQSIPVPSTLFPGQVFHVQPPISLPQCQSLRIASICDIIADVSQPQLSVSENNSQVDANIYHHHQSFSESDTEASFVISKTKDPPTSTQT